MQQTKSKIKIKGTGSSFVTLKDHKENFLNPPTTRLLNSAKNEIGKISKDILQNINKTLSEEIKLNERRNTEKVINWFKSIPNKHLHTFLMYDIQDFYPSIKEKLLWETIRFAKLCSFIINKDIDISMSAYNVAELCELIGIFMLPLLGKHISKNHIRLYRDDGLAILKNTSGSEAEKLKKNFQ